MSPKAARRLVFVLAMLLVGTATFVATDVYNRAHHAEHSAQQAQQQVQQAQGQADRAYGQAQESQRQVDQLRRLYVTSTTAVPVEPPTRTPRVVTVRVPEPNPSPEPTPPPQPTVNIPPAPSPPPVPVKPPLVCQVVPGLCPKGK